jgi:diacylglycerol kinase family enzyme
MGLPRDLAAAARCVADALAEDRVRHISLGTFNGRRYGFAAGIGFDAEAVRRVDSYGRRRGRRAGDAYFALQIATLAAEGRYRQPTLTVEANGVVERASSVLVANVHPWSYVGARPLKLAPQVEPEGGFDVVAPRRMFRRDVPAIARYVLLDGAHALRQDPRIAYLHDLQSAIVRCDRPLPAQVDGDDLGDVLLVRLGLDRDGARLLV